VGNTERYDKIDEHQWTDAAQPLSTFSDVDTAVRQCATVLNAGQLP
jgi:hypothetical protein